MEKLYRKSSSGTEYWEAWEKGGGVYLVHWGELGTRGQQKTVKSGFFKSAASLVEREMALQKAQGFNPIETEDHALLIVEYLVDEMGTIADVEKRHRLEVQLSELLGWTGLGACDGGSIGSNSMEVASFVVDYEVAERVIRDDLEDTEFADFARIYVG